MTTDWIRPWWPGRDGDHIRRDCPLLAEESDSPEEGTGWLNLATISDPLCPSCFAWDATCDQCGVNYSETKTETDSRGDVEQWTHEHVCISTRFTLTPYVRQPKLQPIPADQAALFHVSTLEAVR